MAVRSPSALAWLACWPSAVFSPQASFGVPVSTSGEADVGGLVAVLRVAEGHRPPGGHWPSKSCEVGYHLDWCTAGKGKLCSQSCREGLGKSKQPQALL